MLTDTEIMRQLAERVMGWDVVGRPLNRRAHYDFSGPHVFLEIDGTFWRGVKADGGAQLPWCPLDSMNDAWMIVQKLQADGWDYELGSCMLLDGIITEGHSAEFMRGAYDLYAESYVVTAATPQRAICEAALKTREEEV